MTGTGVEKPGPRNFFSSADFAEIFCVISKNSKGQSKLTLENIFFLYEIVFSLKRSEFF